MNLKKVSLEIKQLHTQLGIRLIPSLEEYRREIFEPGWEEIWTR